MTIQYNTENCVISVGVSEYERSVAWYRDVLGFPVVYELEEYGWGELKTPFGFNIGIGQTETVTPGSVPPTSGVADIDSAIAYLREHDVRSRTGTRSPAWSASRRSTTPTARRGCW